VVDVEAIHAARGFVRRSLAAGLKQALLAGYHSNRSNAAYATDTTAIGHRILKNLCLDYLMELDEPELHRLCAQQFDSADNMTDVLAALNSVINLDCAERARMLGDFLDRWRHDALVMDKWFAIQATSALADTRTIEALMRHAAFEFTNPNKVRALIGSFARHNPLRFHAVGGEGYQFVADQIIRLNALNPQISAGLMRAFSRWRKFDPVRQDLMKTQIARVMNTAQVSKDVYEVASTILG
ncbi:MAG: aminopeptidase N C-terminal domain-containing protein, partial [Burkholderiales bacterium]